MTAELLDTTLAAHRAGRLDDAAAGYERLLAADPRASDLRHNLGMVRLGQGRFAPALPLLERAYAEDGGNPGWLGSLPTIALTLYDALCWEQAGPWLARALQREAAQPGTFDGATTARLHEAQARARPPAHLAPEVWDAAQGRAFLRAAPREAATYVYAIDVVGTCNLRCPSCPVGNFQAAQRPVGFMPLAMFERILAKIARESPVRRPRIFFFNWGEPLLHPELPAMVAAVKAAGFESMISSNLNVERGLRELLRAGPDELKISLSGFMPEHYARTHARGSLHLVKANLHLLRHLLDETKATTRVWVGQHLYKDTQHEVAAVRALCDELGFEHHPVAASLQPLEKVVAVLEGEPVKLPVLDLLIERPETYVPRMKAERSAEHDCELRSNQTVINHDGKVALCCGVYDRPQMLGLSFLDTPHAELEAAKYRHSFWGRCMRHGLAYPVRDARRIGA
jgi:MoaA/NifB/PqqE/SkfB family radical SAM enzyme